MATAHVRDGKEVHEIALLQVQIDGKWVTWSRIEKGFGEQWDGNYLVQLSEAIPKRITFKKPHCTGGGS